MQQRKIKVIFVDDHDSVRQGYVSVISSYPDMEVIADFATLAGFFKKLPEIDPDVVIMDIQLKDGNGIEAAFRIRKERPDVEVIILSMLEDEESILRSIEAGASGYFLKDASLSDIAEAIRMVHEGGALFYPKITRKILVHFSRKMREQEILHKKSPSELEEDEVNLMRMVSQGYSNKEISERIGEKESTIKATLREVYHKLGAKDRASAVFKAVKKGII